jgi:hypothetical protein
MAAADNKALVPGFMVALLFDCCTARARETANPK